MWTFQKCDTEKDCRWSFHPDVIGDRFLKEVFPKLRALEGMNWGTILTDASSKKKHHSCDVATLSRDAQNRLQEMHFDENEIYAFHAGNTDVLYGFRDGRVCHLIWYDPDHGNQKTCVCPSRQKHT